MTTKEEEDNAEAHIDAVQESIDIPFDEAISASYGNPNPDYEDDGNNEKGDVHVATAGVSVEVIANADADADADEEHLVEGAPPPPSPYNDDISEMTYSRRLARYLSKYDWYNPSKNVKGFHAPNLDVAWEYFEHSKLPRHFIAESSLATNDQTTSQKSFHRRRNVKDILQRAEYGEEEEKTLLYSVLKTPETELGDFGIGVGIYFWTLRVLCIIAFLAGLINIPNMIYFSSDEYGDGGQLGNISKWGLLGSAACIDTKWVACPNCTKSDWDRFPRDYSRFATDSDGRSFIYKNNCQVTFDEGIVAWASFFFVMVSIMVMNFFSKYREHYIDSLSQTSSDYTVTVENPPIHATNPDEWKDFFYQIAGDDPIHVTLVTVAIDNEDLIKILVKRRKQIQNLIYLLKPGVQFEGDNLDQMANQTIDLTWVQKHLLFKKTGPELLKAIRDLEEQAKEESKKDFGASNIFITFETEKQQKMILNKLALPRSQIMADGILVPNDIKFLGKYALAVKEPAEPSSIRWHDLDESLTVQIVQRVISTTLVLIAIVLGALLVQVVKSQTDSASYAALTVTAINQITPYICKFCNRFESHSNDGSYQTSLYTKTTFFKWTNTAIVTVIITPFTYKIRDGSDYLINSVYSIFFAELLTNPAIKISDIWGNIQRHYLGPRELDQRRMNLRFGGGAFVLSDRYTEVTKILFLTFFYSSIFPAGFFFCAASLFINYWVDKFSLLVSFSSSLVS